MQRLYLIPGLVSCWKAGSVQRVPFNVAVYRKLNRQKIDLKNVVYTSIGNYF